MLTEKNALLVTTATTLAEELVKLVMELGLPLHAVQLNVPSALVTLVVGNFHVEYARGLVVQDMWSITSARTRSAREVGLSVL
jgi:hypothetical protein